MSRNMPLATLVAKSLYQSQVKAISKYSPDWVARLICCAVIHLYSQVTPIFSAEISLSLASTSGQSVGASPVVKSHQVSLTGSSAPARPMQATSITAASRIASSFFIQGYLLMMLFCKRAGLFPLPWSRFCRVQPLTAPTVRPEM